MDTHNAAGSPPATLDTPTGTSPDLPDWLTVAEAAAILRVGQKAVRAGVAAGTIPSIRAGRLVRIPRSALDFGGTGSVDAAAPARAAGGGRLR